jgi:hypothetical protein
MSGTVALPRLSLDRMAGLIAIPKAATMHVILLTHSIFDGSSVASAPVSAGVERRIARTAGIRPATIHTPLARSPLRLTHGSGRKPIGDTAPALTLGCY